MARERRSDDELGAIDEVAQLEEVAVDPEGLVVLIDLAAEELDPVERTVEALERREGGHWLLHGTFGGNATSAIPPFDAVAFDLREWWGGPEQPDDEPIGLR